jgi:hypothetical protein
MPHGPEVVVVARFSVLCRWSIPPSGTNSYCCEPFCSESCLEYRQIVQKLGNRCQGTLRPGARHPLRQSLGIPPGRKPPDRARELWLDPEYGRIPLCLIEQFTRCAAATTDRRTRHKRGWLPDTARRRPRTPANDGFASSRDLRQRADIGLDLRHSSIRLRPAVSGRFQDHRAPP